MMNFLKILSCFLVFFCVFSCSNQLSTSQQYSPRVPVGYERLNKPNSRLYQNPYNNVPYNYYPYYDMDNYYVPPRQNNPFDANDNQVRGSRFDINNK